ncbi:hypothetical protein [Chryseobacterium indoltheticum]|uniref:Tyr recombinase domain-containing protein n=1 Tax=Chryseobacterium indoltheticum TaxID=254 RepID=A0A381FG95_9FLAO|nr:hypothetical protein [Chryseobacterium indoltheticum]AZA74549.1 hypothetical protein EG358_12600 [Chryseobacterium indoltheticum]SIQ08614.1 hypothetical protein SAMN05421682_102295 [Chryseobacterium indoltheticum]SUX45566.1 Uncharacterised protein [Chryseobacterium indoltheticum]
MNSLDRHDIDNVCLRILENVRRDYNYYYPHVYFMYHYGVRIGEVFYNRIVYDAKQERLIVDPQKNNNNRIEKIKDANTLKLLESLHMSSDLNWMNIRNLQRIIDKVNPVGKLMCGNKKIGAHLFRHNWIRKQLIFGHQFDTINAMLGYTKQTVADTYLVAKIYY